MYKEEEQIKADMLENISNTFDKSQNSFMHDAVAGTALELASFYMRLEFYREKLNINNLEGRELADYIYQRTGLRRREASFASGYIVVTGEQGANVERGTLVAAGETNYEILEAAVIDSSGEVVVSIQATEKGSVGNTPSGAIDIFPETINGLISVTNPEPITNGYDEEEDDTYRERYFERIQSPATSANKHHYLVWAKEVIGVGDARVEPLWAGDNTVRVIIINADKKPADAKLISDVQEYIDPDSSGLGEGRAPIGAFTTVISAEAKDINIKANVVIESNNNLTTVQENISEKITEYLKEVAFKDEIVSYARVGAAILSAEGLVDYSNLEINGGIVSVSVGKNEIAVLKGVDLID